MAAPHGGRLVDRTSCPDTSGMMEVRVGAEVSDDAENIADGIFSPLEGFLGREDLESVVDKGRLAGGLAWTVPIVLDVGAEEAARIIDARDVLLRGPSGSAVLHAEESYKFDRKRTALGVYGTDDPAHPGVARTLSMNDVLVSGRVDLASRPDGAGTRARRMPPSRTREEFGRAGWRTVCAFQTRNPPHVAHEMLQKASITTRDGVFVNPIIGRKKPGDFADDVILRCYEAMISGYYPENRCMLGTLHTEMRYAGPREAIHHAIMRQNYGCTHIIIGRDHAGVGKFYPPTAAQEIFADYPELGIEPVFFPAFFYCRECLTYAAAGTCPHGNDSREQISGTALREMFQAGKAPSKYIMRPEVAQIILDHPSPFVA
ncbi:MAG: sulfate adenylyltransferase [Nitrosopumilus sp.]|nr:sulfate adenylyltransferase [Nitrosopumilus sp.]MDA7942560.1 sulfate adenylyltransferase [Nitrosopumilus sp.]